MAEHPPVTLMQCFDRWVEARPARGRHAAWSGELRDESVSIYRDMWTSLVRYWIAIAAESTERAAGGLRRDDLLHFLNRGTHAARLRDLPVRREAGEGDLSDRYAWRMLHLIDRVLEHASEPAHGLTRQVAAELLQEPPFVHANARDKEPEVDILSAGEVEQLMAFLRQDGASAEAIDGAPWKLSRDRAAIALMLGAGLSPGDLRALTLEHVDWQHRSGERLPWKLIVVADGTSPLHVAPVAPWAATVLARWIAQRSLLRLPGDRVFPSTAQGKPWSHQGCHLALTRTLAAAQVRSDSPFRLRHTYAVRQLDQGRPEEDVAAWLGQVDTSQMKRYRHLTIKPDQQAV
ncbi:tyrosine-type recombinase/integrase [Sphaerotilus hippei]|nr:tyrosine-type recombinase/integrase [Sphaerotilus hippei]